ncbi:MAG: SixA phosphatase family protein [Verrucomicrobiota bacterium]
MVVYLMRHAEARPGEPDVARPLTAKGRRQARQAGRGPFAAASAEARSVEHSGLVRSLQTAELAMRSAGVPRARLRRLAGLAPEDDPTVTARLLATSRSSRLIVGHNPHLAGLFSLLSGAIGSGSKSEMSSSPPSRAGSETEVASPPTTAAAAARGRAVTADQVSA